MAVTPGPVGGATSGRDLLVAKRAVRKRILARRAARSERDRVRAGEELARVVADLPAVNDARCVAAYVGREGEPPTYRLLDALSGRGVRILLPVIGVEPRLTQGWAEYTGAADLVERSLGRPLEPSGADLGPTAVAAADVVLVPALAVDTSGTRLGYGAGWYDKALTHVRPGTPLVALVYDDEVFDAGRAPLPRGPHDRAVGSAATPRGWIDFGTDPVDPRDDAPT